MANVFGQMKEVYKLQREAKEMQKKMRDQKLTGESEDGKIKIYMNAAQELEDLFIDDSIMAEGMGEVVRKGFKEAFKDYQKKLAKQLSSSFDIEDLKRALGN